ncbi:hypothetical protein KC338_g248 [Hortaea werneckii]|nr:hypothetical protein KC338_g248 [Hortaea werneckii]
MLLRGGVGAEDRSSCVLRLGGGDSGPSSSAPPISPVLVRETASGLATVSFSRPGTGGAPPMPGMAIICGPCSCLGLAGPSSPASLRSLVELFFFGGAIGGGAPKGLNGPPAPWPPASLAMRSRRRCLRASSSSISSSSSSSSPSASWSSAVREPAVVPSPPPTDDSLAGGGGAACGMGKAPTPLPDLEGTCGPEEEGGCLSSPSSGPPPKVPESSSVISPAALWSASSPPLRISCSGTACTGLIGASDRL